MQCLVKSTTGNGKQSISYTHETGMQDRVVSHEDKARRVIYWYYIQKTERLNKIIPLSISLNFVA